MTVSTNSSAGESDVVQLDASAGAHELLSRLLPLLVADAQEKIAQEARQAARQQVDHALDEMRGALAVQTSNWIDQVSSLFRGELDRALVTVDAEWRKQIERTLDPIREATYRQVGQAVQATWEDGSMSRAVDGRPRAASEPRADAAELASGQTVEKRQAARSPQHSSSSESMSDDAKADETELQETTPSPSKRGAGKRSSARSRSQAIESPDPPASPASTTTERPAKRRSAPPAATASRAKRAKSQASQSSATEKPARHSSTRQSERRSGSGSSPAHAPAHAPAQRTQTPQDSGRTQASRRSRREG